MKKSNIFQRLVSLLLITACLFSCEKTIDLIGYGSISGVVVDAATLLPIEGANIVTTPSSVSVLTSEAGIFKISDVVAGDVRINATKPGYKTGSATVNVLDKKTVEVTITMLKDDDDFLTVKISDPSPELSAVDQLLTVNLCWNFAADSNQTKPDSVFFDVIIYSSESSAVQLIADHISDSCATVENLDYGSSYFWQVIAFENNVEISRSEVYSFQTIPFPVNHFIYSAQFNASSEIFSSKQDGTDKVNISRYEQANDWYARVSPLNDMIAFVSTRDIQSQLYTMDLNGKNQKRISTLPLSGYHNPGTGFCWSPDGGQILYPVYDKLYIVDRDGTDLKFFAQAPANRHWREVHWNGYTNKIVALTMGANIFDTEIYTMDEDGTDMSLLFENEPGRMDSPSYSIDGTKIIYTRDVAGYNVLDGRQLDARIFIKHIDSIASQDLSVDKPEGTNDLLPRFSPDGAYIIFVNTSNTGTEPHAIWKMDIYGSGREKLFENATFPEWW